MGLQCRQPSRISPIDCLAAQSAGFDSTKFDVFTRPGIGAVYLIDRAKAGDVATFTVTNAGGSSAATDLGLGTGILRDVDVEKAGVEFVIAWQSRQVIGSGSCMGTPPPRTSAWRQVLHRSFISAWGWVGRAVPAVVCTGRWGGFWRSYDQQLCLQCCRRHHPGPATLQQLWEGLDNPFPWMVGDAPDYSSALDVSMNLKPEPAIDGVPPRSRLGSMPPSRISTTCGTEETVSPTYPDSDEVKTLLGAVEHLSIANVLDYLEGAGDYLVACRGSPHSRTGCPACRRASASCSPLAMRLGIECES